MDKVKFILHLIDKINERVAKTASLLIFLILGITVYEVIRRYGFNAPTIWAFESNYMLYGIYFMLGGAHTFYLGKHVNVDILYAKFSPKTRAKIDLVTSFFFFFFCGAMLVYGARFAWSSVLMRERLSSAWAPPIYPVKLIIPISAFLIILQGVAKFIRDLITVITEKEKI